MNTTTTTASRFKTVAGVLAVTIACSSGAYAAGTMITSSNQIKPGVVNTGDIKNGTVKVKDLNPKTVTQVKKLEAWHDAVLQGSWTTFPNRNNPGFRLDAANGVVHLRGAAGFGSDNGSNKTIFDLPAGYAPAHPVTVNVATFNGFGTESEFGALEIGTDGSVTIYGSGDDRFVSFEDVSFSIG